MWSHMAPHRLHMGPKSNPIWAHIVCPPGSQMVYHVGPNWFVCWDVPFPKISLYNMILCYDYKAMLYAMLCCAVLSSAVLCCAVQCCAVLCCAELSSAVLCCAVLSSAVLCCAVQC